MKTFVPFVLGFAVAMIVMVSAEGEANCAPANNPLSNWDNYKKHFNRAYSADEDAERKKIFDENVKKVNDHNCRYQQKKESWTMGINQFTDQRPDEVPMGFGVKKGREQYK